MSETDLKVNIPLLRKAVEWVEQQEKLPEWAREWDQEHWVSEKQWAQLDHLAAVECGDESAEKYAPHCGTAYCVAGYIGQLEDPRFAASDYIKVSRDEALAMGFSHEDLVSKLSISSDGFLMIHVADLAELRLGLGSSQCDDLFDGANDAKTIRILAEEFAGEKL